MISNVESFSAKLLAEITNTCSHSSKCGIKESACNAGAAEDPGLIPESGRFPPPLEEVLATHSSILAWRIPWTEAPGGLQSMGSPRVGQDLVTEHTN